MGQGLQTLQSPIDFWSAIQSGDPTRTAQMAGPTASNIAQVYGGATDAASRGLPGGGARAATLAGLPFSQAQQVGNFMLGLLPQAAQALAGLGGEQAQIGQGIGAFGTQLTGQGLEGLNAAQQGALQKMNLNLQEGSPFQDILKAVGVAAPILGGIGGILSAGGQQQTGPSVTNLAPGWGTGMGGGAGTTGTTTTLGGPFGIWS